MLQTYNSFSKTLCESSSSRYYLSVNRRRTVDHLVEGTVIDLSSVNTIKAVNTRVSMLLFMKIGVPRFDGSFFTNVVVTEDKGVRITKWEITVITTR